MGYLYDADWNEVTFIHTNAEIFFEIGPLGVV